MDARSRVHAHIFADSDARARTEVATGSSDDRALVHFGQGARIEGTKEISILAQWDHLRRIDGRPPTPEQALVTSSAQAIARARAPVGDTDATAVNNTALTAAIIGAKDAMFITPSLQHLTDADAEVYVHTADRSVHALADFGTEIEGGELKRNLIDEA
jgi:hypothetical protein